MSRLTQTRFTPSSGLRPPSPRRGGEGNETCGDPIPLLKKCVDNCADHAVEPKSDFSFECKFLEIAKFGHLDNTDVQLLEEFEGDEKVAIHADMTKNGSKFRFELDIDILKACWKVGHSQLGIDNSEFEMDAMMNDLD